MMSLNDLPKVTELVKIGWDQIKVSYLLAQCPVNSGARGIRLGEIPEKAGSVHWTLLQLVSRYHSSPSCC